MDEKGVSRNESQFDSVFKIPAGHHDPDLKINGVTVLDVGASSVEATDEVYNLVEATDLEGTYISGQAGAVLVAGGSVLSMKNDKGVVIKLKSSQKGARLTLAAGGMTFKLK